MTVLGERPHALRPQVVALRARLDDTCPPVSVGHLIATYPPNLFGRLDAVTLPDGAQALEEVTIQPKGRKLS